MNEKEFKLTKKDILDYSIIEENEFVKLKINKKDGEEIEYNFNTNPENPNLGHIKEELENGFNLLNVSDNNVIEIWDQNYRLYVHFTFPDQTIKRYSYLGNGL